VVLTVFAGAFLYSKVQKRGDGVVAQIALGCESGTEGVTISKVSFDSDSLRLCFLFPWYFPAAPGQLKR